MAEANKFGAGYLKPLTGGILDAAFKKAIRGPGQSFRELLDNLEGDGLHDDETRGLRRGGRLVKSPGGRWVRDKRLSSG